jgi:hypothetical protein
MSSTPVPSPSPALDTASRRNLRDLIFAWLYVSIGQLDTIGTRSADDIIADLKSSVSIPAGSQLYQDVETWITQIQANPAAFDAVAGVFKAAGTTGLLSSPWIGPTRHPSIEELNLTIAHI